MSIDARLQRQWYERSGAAPYLLPLSWLYGALIALRRWAYRVGVFTSFKLERPVIVIGNLTVGGTGKTPLVIWLAKTLMARGLKVGIITRGYGGAAASWPQSVSAESDALAVGDEAVLIAQQTGATVVAGPDRVACAQRAIAAGAQVVISDDGLQHYRLQRDVELLVVDASRLFGNGHLLPAGPLREPTSRVQQADLVLLNQRASKQKVTFSAAQVNYRVVLTQLRSIKSGEVRSLASLAGQQVHVVTAIGHPQSFLQSLQEAGLRVDARVLRDHAALTVDDIEFGDALPVLMTEKDAVKCRRIAGAKHWAVGAEVVFESADQLRLLQCVEQCLSQVH